MKKLNLYTSIKALCSVSVYIRSTEISQNKDIIRSNPKSLSRETRLVISQRGNELHMKWECDRITGDGSQDLKGFSANEVLGRHLFYSKHVERSIFREIMKKSLIILLVKSIKFRSCMVTLHLISATQTMIGILRY